MRWVPREQRLRQWHRWFAWRPVRLIPERFGSVDVPVQKAWLEYVDRKERKGSEYNLIFRTFDYRVAAK